MLFRSISVREYSTTKTEVLETVLNLLKKKDKIIDEMAKSIVHNNEIDYEICDNVHEQGAECDGYARETNKSCEQCIKQYFERIAEEN